MKLHSLNLRGKILLGYLVIAGLLIISSGWAIYNFVRLNRAIEDIMVASYRSVVASQKMIESLERQDSATLLMLFGSNQDSLDIFSINQQEFDKWFNVAEGNITYRGETETLKHIKDGHRLYFKYFEAQRELFVTGRLDQAKRFYLVKTQPQFNQVKQECHILLEINQKHMVKADDLAKTDAQKAILSTSFVTLLALALALILGYKISNIIILPTLRLTESAKRIGEGHLDEVIEVETMDEIGRLAEEFNRMTQRLKEYDKNNVDRLIAERRKSDAIIRSIPDPILVVDADFKIIVINSAAEKAFDVREKQVKGFHILEVVNNESIFEALKHCAQTSLPLRNLGMETAIKLQVEGKWRYFLHETTPVVDREQHLLGMVVFLGDVTHLKEVDQMKTDFVSAASHEFRTPLTSIIMSVGLLLENAAGDLNHQQQQFLEIIKEDSERLNRLVSDLLDLSRMESGKLEIIKEPAYLGNIIQASLEPLQLQLDEQNIAVVIDPQLEKLSQVKVDANKITWVFNNLISNALKLYS